MMDCKKLIILVQERRSLWDPQHSQYHNRSASRRLWCEIGTLLDSTSVGVKTKWQRLKDTHRREMKRSTLPTGSESQANESKWKYFDQMSFLENTYSSRRLVGNNSKRTQCQPENEPAVEVSDTENDSFEGVSRIDQDGDESVSSVSKDKHEQLFKSSKKRVPTQVAHLQAVRGTKQRMIEEDEDYFFLMSLLPHLRAIPQHKKLHTRIKLQQVIIEDQDEYNLPPSSAVHQGTVPDDS